MLSRRKKLQKLPEKKEKENWKSRLKKKGEKKLKENELKENELKENVREKLVLVRSVGDSACGGHKQIAALQLLAGIGGKNCKKTLSDGTVHGFSTFMSYYILSGLARTCGTQAALEALRTYYGAMLDLGATTFWEDFDVTWAENAARIDEMPVAGKKDIHGDYGEFCYSGFRHSLCHGWSSGPAAWCIRHVLGIQPLEAGAKKVLVKPFLGDLAWAEGAMALPDGQSVKVRAEKRPDGSLDVKVDAPAWCRIVRR